jgi:hypothetical protein
MARHFVLPVVRTASTRYLPQLEKYRIDQSFNRFPRFHVSIASTLQ